MRLSSLVIATTVSLLVYALPTSSTQQSEKAAGKQKENALPRLELLKTVDRSTLPGKDSGSSFRAVRHNPTDPKIACTIINIASIPFLLAPVCRWDADQWQVVRLRQVSDRGLTCLDVRHALKISLNSFSCPDARVMTSVDGRFIAFGSSDDTIGILDAKRAVESTPTTLRFNPSASPLISGSADNTRCRCSTHILSDNLEPVDHQMIVPLLAVLFAIIAQQMHQA